LTLDLDTCLYLDFEARSEVDITEVGAHAYAEHPSTELLCCGWVVGLTDPVKLWLPEDPEPAEWGMQALLGGRWVAHNKDTERCLLWRKLSLVIPSERWIDCATVTSAAGMPRNLHDVGEALHLVEQKLAKTALLALAKPRKLTKKNAKKWWSREERPELYEQLYTYCLRDTDVMRKALAALPPYHWVMPAKEERLAVLTDKMNDLGVEVDLPGVTKAAAVVAEHGARAARGVRHPGPRRQPALRPRRRQGNGHGQLAQGDRARRAGCRGVTTSSTGAAR
jgi:DNA polymerase